MNNPPNPVLPDLNIYMVWPIPAAVCVLIAAATMLLTAPALYSLRRAVPTPRPIFAASVLAACGALVAAMIIALR